MAIEHPGGGAICAAAADSREVVFRARGLTKVYRMGEVEIQALAGVDLDLYRSELVVLLGPSGSGKSTLLNILGGLDVPTAGSVRFLDHDLTRDDDAVSIAEGAAMTVDLGDGTWRPARVYRIEPAAFTKISPLGVEEQRVLVLGKLAQPPANLGDRFRVRARIVLWRGDDLLLVPSGAVFRTDEGWGTYVVEASRARLRALELGQRGRDAAQLLAGATAGEQVILYPGAGIADGVRVTPR